MPLTFAQQSEIVDQVVHALRQLDAALSALEDIRATREELGTDVETFLEPYFDRAEWQVANNALTTVRNRLRNRIAGARGSGLDELRKQRQPVPVEEGR